VPPTTLGVPPYTQTIADVLPYQYLAADPTPEIVSPEEPPELISIEQCTTSPDQAEMRADFQRVCDGIVPDYLLLIVDTSGSFPVVVRTAVETFRDSTWLATNYPDTDVRYNTFSNERWVDEMTTEIQAEVIDELR